jgi:hypothetical protein
LEVRVLPDEFSIDPSDLVCPSALQHNLRKENQIWIRVIESLTPRKEGWCCKSLDKADIGIDSFWMPRPNANVTSMNLEVVAEVLKNRFDVEHIDSAPDHLEVELRHYPRDSRALLSVEVVIPREGRLILNRIDEREPPHFERRDRTKDYEENADVQQLLNSVEQEVERLKEERGVVFSVTTANANLTFDILEAKMVEQNKTVAKGAEIRFLSGTIREALAAPETITFLLVLARDVAIQVLAGLAANYLFKKLESKPEIKLKIMDTEVPVDKDAIERAILRYVT